METTLTKWGNSQGVLIPKILCNDLEINIGDTLEIEKSKDGMILRPVTRKYGRSEKKNAAEIFGSYKKTYQTPVDFDSHNNEIDWGKSEGKELPW